MNRRILGILSILVIIISIPLTAFLAQKAQQLRSSAAPNGDFNFVSTSNETPISETSTQNVRLKVFLPDNWTFAQSDSTLAQTQSIIPKAYASHCSQSTNCSTCTSQPHCWWAFTSGGGNCREGFGGSCTSGVSSYAITTPQCGSPVFCPAATQPPAATNTPVPTQAPPGTPPTSTSIPTSQPPGGNPTPTSQPPSGQPSCRFFRLNNTNIPRDSSRSGISFNVGLNNPPQNSYTEVWINSNVGSIGSVPDSGWTRVGGRNTPNSDSFNVSWTESNPSSFGEGIHAATVSVIDTDTRIEVANYRTDSDCGATVQFVAGSTAGGTVLREIRVWNDDTNGGGGSSERRFSASELIPLRQADSSFIIPWTINGGQGQHVVKMQFIHPNGQTTAISKTITLSGPSGPPPTDIGARQNGGCQGTTGGLSSACGSGFPNIQLNASWGINQPVPGRDCNVFIRAGTIDYQISTNCNQIQPMTFSGVIRDLQGRTHTITNDGIYELWVSNGENTNASDACYNMLADRKTLNCSTQPPTGSGTPPFTLVTPSPGAGCAQFTTCSNCVGAASPFSCGWADGRCVVAPGGIACPAGVTSWSFRAEQCATPIQCSAVPTATIIPPPGATATPIPGTGAAPQVSECQSVTIDGLPPGSFALGLNEDHNIRITMRNHDPSGTITNQRPWTPQDKLKALGQTSTLWGPNPASPLTAQGPPPAQTPTGGTHIYAFSIQTPAQPPPQNQPYEFKWRMMNAEGQEFGAGCDLAFTAGDFSTGSGQTIIPIPALLQEYVQTLNRPKRTPNRQSRPDADVTLVLTTDRSRKFTTKANLQWQPARPDNPNEGFFKGIANFVQNTLPTGANTYDVYVKDKNHLTQKVLINQSITTGGVHEIASVGGQVSVVGDIASGQNPNDIHARDNTITVFDYNVIANCFGPKMDSADCGGRKHDADVDDDGDVDIFDYNWVIQNFSLSGEVL